jgi:hypothetical protein
MTRRDFFSADIDQAWLLEAATSTDSTSRWLAVISAGQFHESWACDLIWGLKDDPDENTRTAAQNALKNFPAGILAGRQAQQTVVESRFGFQAWRSRPLPQLQVSERAVFGAAVVDLVSTEGPTTGLRVLNRLVKCQDMSGSKHAGKFQISALLDDLVMAGRLARCDSHLADARLEMSIYHIPGQPEVVIRPRGGRFIAEIPVNEAKAVLLEDRRAARDLSNKDVAFAALRRFYDIEASELHLVADALEGQWSSLFAVV